VTKRRTKAPAKRKRASRASGRATYLARLRAGEAHVLELVAAGVPLSQTLDALARTFEAQADGMLASILLVEDGARVRHAAAPSLAEAWVRAVDGQPIGPNQGSCGTAAFLKQSVIVSDIATDPRWVNYRDAALAVGLRACWSVPIMGPQDAVLGTFALYYSEPRRPTPRLLDLAAHASHLATVAIQHHRHQETILESESRARLIVDNALDANVLMNREGIVTGWNARAAAMFGWSAEEAVGRKLSGLIIPERFRAQHEQGLERYVETGVGPILNRRLEVTALHRAGHEFPVELAVAPLRRGDQVMFSAFIEDITASKHAQEALRQSQQHLSLVYDHVDDVLFDLGVEADGFRFLSVNPAFTAATGLAAEQVVGKLVHDVIPEPSLSLVLGKYAEAVRTHKTVRWQETTSYSTGTRYGDVAITPVYDAQDRPIHLIGSVRDVTEQKRMEGEVRQLQKLEAIGRLSGGIAHDFNNILGVIIGVGNMLLKDVQDTDSRSQVEEIVKAGERGANLTRQFLAFGRQQVLQPQVLDLNGVVRNLETMLRRLIRADIALTTTLAPDLWLVQADPGQVEQVVVNLAVNARDAMPNGGQLSIATANVQLDREFAETGPYAMMAVTDTGHGMDDETKKRVFEPFFTTKEIGKGTGLGLATVYGIITQSGGCITVDSTPGKGTTFTVYLPKGARQGDDAPPERRERRTPMRRGLQGLHVLVVEDESALRRAFERMLVRLQCEVTMVSSGEEALAVAGTKSRPPDVLLTDLILPGMSGRELIESLRAIRPELKVLLMSGYAPNDMAPAAALDAGAFLQKPFTITELADAIQSLVDAS